MEASHMGVRRRHARPDVHQVGPLLDGPCQEMATGFLRTVVTADRRRLAELEDGLIQDSRHAPDEKHSCPRRVRATAWCRIPSLSIKLRSVLGWTLRMAPAPLGPLITQPVLSSTRRTCWRCISSSESVDDGSGAAPGSPLLLDFPIGKRSPPSLKTEPLEASDVESGFGSTPSSDRITARSTRFWSSRTLPGQWYVENAFIVVCGICSIRFPMRLENISTKCRSS